MGSLAVLETFQECGNRSMLFLSFNSATLLSSMMYDNSCPCDCRRRGGIPATAPTLRGFNCAFVLARRPAFLRMVPSELAVALFTVRRADPAAAVQF